MDYLVIPAYEPDYNLIKLIKKIHHKSDFHIIVIDDGSSSKCQIVFEQAEQYATVLRHQVNQGKGRALKTAFYLYPLYPSTENIRNGGNSRCGRPAQGLGYFPRSEQGF